MTPKLYIYKRIEILFFSNDHLPIHVHAICNDMEMKVIFYFNDNRLRTIIYKEVEGKKKFSPDKLKDLKKIIKAKKYEIIDLWIRYFIANGRIETKIIHKL